MIATIAGLMDSHNSKKAFKKGSEKSQSGLLLVYVAFLSVAAYVYHVIADHAFSSLLTLSAVFQCLAFSLLGTQIIISGSVVGISAKSLFLDVFALASRLTATVFEVSYLPSDQTGDWIYQAFDGLSLAMVLWVLYRVCIVQRTTYEADEDAFPAKPLALGSLVLAAIFHGNLNQSPFYDTMWMCSVFASAISVLPQIWMMTHRRGKSAALTSHFVAVMALARVLSGTYMWHAYPEIAADPFTRFGYVKYAGYAVIVAHVVHLLLLGDFAFFYIKNVANSGLSADLDLSPQLWEV
jgi:uncharacterized membrane protein (DUF485 family)